MKKISILLVAIPYFILQFLFPSFDPSYEIWQYESIIAHATGNIDGHVYTNSKEAILKNHASGVNIFEIDVKRTSDGEVVLIHNWSDIQIHEDPTHQEFMDFKIFGKYTTLDIMSLAELMAHNTSLVMTLDAKNADTAQLYFEIMKIVEENYPSTFDRWVPIIYEFNEYNQLETLIEENLVNRLSHYMYGFYKNGSNHYTNAFEFLERISARKKITSILTSFVEVQFNKDIRKHNTNIPMYYHTVNSKEFLDLVINDLQGDGVSTDLLW